MKKNILKETHYNGVAETVFGIIFCIIILSFFIFELLSGNKTPKATHTGGIIVFSVLLLSHIRRLFAKNPQVRYININGWKYRSFQKMSKWKFIFISGFVNSILFDILIVVIFLSLLIKSDLSPLEIILTIIGLCIISAIPYGYINYKKCAGVNMDSDLQHPS